MDSLQRSPVFVRSGTSVADVEPAPLPRMALPARSPRRAGASSEPSLTTKPNAVAGLRAKLEPTLRYARAHLVLPMVLAPVLFSLCLIAVSRHGTTRARRTSTANGVVAATPALAAARAALEPPKEATLAELERRPAGSLSSRELVLLAEWHAQQKRATASALRQKLEADPAAGKDSAVQSQLLGFAADPATAADALAAMAALEPPSGTDLLYEVWTATQVRTDTTELARSLLYSADLRSKASPALAAALDLRVAESCEQYQAILPKALTDGDRRAVHLLTKLNGKRGCGAKKTEDCYACLRGKGDELTATINAVKSRRPPSFTNP